MKLIYLDCQICEVKLSFYTLSLWRAMTLLICDTLHFMHLRVKVANSGGVERMRYVPSTYNTK